jgi:hypothetical protein
MSKVDVTDVNHSLPAPLKGLIHVIAKSVIADYYQEILHKPESENHESSPLRPLQQRQATRSLHR